MEAKQGAFDQCSAWLARLAESNKGHSTSGYRLVRERFVEVPVEGDALQERPGNVVVSDAMSIHSRLFLFHVGRSQKMQPQDVGEGITQVVPVIAALVRASHESKTIESNLVAIEQPELHLHPSLAAKLGDLFISTMFTERGARALIETHSEHLLLRILRRIRQTTDGELPEHIPPVKPDDVCVLWVDNLGDGTTFTRLRISDNGRWLDRWPDGFFSERHEELFE